MDVIMHHAELVEMGARRFYVITVEYPSPEGSLAEGELPHVTACLTPYELFETIAAEYGIDPDEPGGWEEILELWAYEPLLAQDATEEMVDPDHIYNAPTVEHARRVRQRKLRKAKGQRGRLRGLTGWTGGARLLNAGLLAHSDEEDPLEFIKRTAPMSREHMAVKAAFVHRERNVRRAWRLAREQGASRRRDMKLGYQRETPEDLARRLLGPDLNTTVRDPMNPPSVLDDLPEPDPGSVGVYE